MDPRLETRVGRLVGQVCLLKSDGLKAVISDWKVEKGTERRGHREKQVGWESFLVAGNYGLGP